MSFAAEANGMCLLVAGLRVLSADVQGARGLGRKSAQRWAKAHHAPTRERDGTATPAVGRRRLATPEHLTMIPPGPRTPWTFAEKQDANSWQRARHSLERVIRCPHPRQLRSACGSRVDSGGRMLHAKRWRGKGRKVRQKRPRWQRDRPTGLLRSTIARSTRQRPSPTLFPLPVTGGCLSRRLPWS